jgi:hypothetical protein
MGAFTSPQVSESSLIADAKKRAKWIVAGISRSTAFVDSI